ncbi:hypothetical protein Taro_036642 [Colocasia esculenta]|uniref:Uncharacterized protein n=1 Tax=Colocasia esculenta TaxID=4460 RepID=A0A843VY50_COLES|nr:hypothetical protein [Colocasia esculenta]
MRDTEQPCEKQRLTTGTATSDLHKVEGPQAEPTCTSDTPRGQGTIPYSATTDDTKERVTKTAVGCLHKTPRENPQTETTKHGLQCQPTKPTELDTARLQPPCRLGRRETQSRNQHETLSQQSNQATATSS